MSGNTYDSVPDAVALGLIDRDMSIQARAGLEEAVVEDYRAVVSSGQLLPWVDLFHDESEGRYYVGDGWHRVEAYDRLGLAKIPANVRPGGRLAALRWALQANRTHGLKRSLDDVRRAVLLAWENRLVLGISEMPTARVVAELVGVSPTTAASHLSKVDTWRDAEFRTGADGKEYKAKKAAPSSEPSSESELGERDADPPPKNADGFEWNEHKVCMNPLMVAVPMCRSFKAELVIELAREFLEDRWVYGFRLSFKGGDWLGGGSPCCRDGESFEYPVDASVAFLEKVKAWLLRNDRTDVADYLETVQAEAYGDSVRFVPRGVKPKEDLDASPGRVKALKEKALAVLEELAEISPDSERVRWDAVIFLVRKTLGDVA